MLLQNLDTNTILTYLTRTACGGISPGVDSLVAVAVSQGVTYLTASVISVSNADDKHKWSGQQTLRTRDTCVVV